MLEELQEAIKLAVQLLARIEARFQVGDSASDLLEQLTRQVTTLENLLKQHGSQLPNGLHYQITQLFSNLQVTISSGDHWLAQFAPTIATNQLRQKVRKAYGLPP